MPGRVPKEVARERERRAWELRQKCWTEARIAEEIGVSQQAVSQILARVSERVVGNLAEDVLAVKREQTAQLKQFVDEMYQAWERSKEDAEVEISKTFDDGGKRGRIRGRKKDNSRMERQRRVEGQVGESRYISEARGALSDIRKIWGIDAPTKHEQGDIILRVIYGNGDDSTPSEASS